MRQGSELRASIPRDLAAVEAFCLEFRAWHKRAGHGRDAFVSELLLREALANCVAHGGGLDECIGCVVRGSAERLMIAVHDGGPGFDWRSRMRGFEVAPACLTSGRGLTIYRRYASRVRFNRVGNGVVLVRLFGREQEKNK